MPRVEKQADRESTPCVYFKTAAHCGGEGLACESFAAYARGVSPIHWRLAPRVPSRDRWERIFEDKAA